jgi:hypothetical protein
MEPENATNLLSLRNFGQAVARVMIGQRNAAASAEIQHFRERPALEYLGSDRRSPPFGSSKAAIVRDAIERTPDRIPTKLQIRIWTGLLKALHDSRARLAVRLIGEHRHLIQDRRCIGSHRCANDVFAEAQQTEITEQ